MKMLYAFRRIDEEAPFLKDYFCELRKQSYTQKKKREGLVQGDRGGIREGVLGRRDAK